MIVGLGNIGKEYESTRHNVGFMVLDSFSLDFSLEKKFQAYVGSTCLNGEKCLFVKPTTFMNLSGIAVRKLSDYYGIKPQDILIIHDDMDLPFGKFKVKNQGSSGGHNGIKSIIESLKTESFCRLKIGISHDHSMNTVDYVLGHFSKTQLDFFQEHYKLYQGIVESFVSNGAEKTMSKFNTKE